VSDVPRERLVRQSSIPGIRPHEGTDSRLAAFPALRCSPTGACLEIFFRNFSVLIGDPAGLVAAQPSLFPASRERVAASIENAIINTVKTVFSDVYFPRGGQTVASRCCDSAATLQACVFAID
jgi:hypothetical protein